jgi:hypothetical protein
VSDSLVDQIERDVLDESVSVAAALRKCVALGGRSGSEALRDWAIRELEGYHGVEEVPDYRIVAAPINVDGIAGNYKVTGQAFPPSGLPEFVRGDIKERVIFRYGIGQIEELSALPEIKIGLPGGGDLVRLMNQETTNRFQHIDSLYWSVSPALVRGILDQVRTALTKLVAELRVTTPTGDVPSEAAATQAMNFVVTGDRNTVTFAPSQASGTGATAATTTSSVGRQDEADGFSIKWERIGAALVGLATIAAAIFGGVQVF